MEDIMEKIRQSLNSLSTKLIILFLLIGLAPMVILSYFQIQETEEELRQSFIRSSTSEIKHVDNTINMYFKKIKEDCKMLAENANVKKADKTITSYVDKTKDEELQMTPSQNSGIEADIYQVYSNYAENHSNLVYTYLATKHGGFIQWPEGPITANYDPRVRPFYKAAMNNKDKVIRTKPYYWEGDDVSLMSTATVVRDDVGEIIGVQVVDIGLENLTDMIENIHIKKKGYIIMTTNDGTILAHPKNRNLNFKNINELGVDKLNNLTNLKEESFTARMNNKDYLMNIYTSPQTGWKFIAVIEKEVLNERVSSLYNKTLWMGLIAAVIIIIITLFVSRRFSQPIVAATEFAQQIAQGNLDIKLLNNKSTGEIGDLIQALNKMRDDLKEMLLNLMDVIEDLSAYSQELSASSEEGNAVIEQNTENIEEMTTSIQQISASSQEVTNLAQETNAQSEVGKEKIEEIANVEEVSRVVNNAVESIEELDTNSKEIGKIVELISNIAEQTNMLALNAAIEAARAGEQGQGFAVVADEIRQLAEETTQATTEIDELIKDTQNKSKISLKTVQQMEDKVKNRKQALEETNEVFTKIKQRIEDTSAHIQQTAASAQNLAENSDQVQQASEDMRNMSQEVTNSSQELANMAQKLQELITDFNI
ncbi:methyl-accepting chemotaxis protein [Acetohalobium arabaticum]|uniref:Methyl-accepting chemotaxis sensory transducer with Cache sensor n=1 Tax=Acetohalobium arabaticum (strain ATCC 49924 / DSM 5501 / Z-7288) TaxID=574087 RepID=D9QUT3_ACEAZ|nr:methyl-accepting chemotaxis protein [Acetohalobium arabaticum]ADL11992.1 methyl-accepting chemotaxis sensory transducer with Cache sensor [Acetohalobium arabaticum DSM 5501]